VTEKLTHALASAPLPPGAGDRLGAAVASGGTQAAAGAAPPAARQAVVEAAQRAFIDGLNEILIVAAIVALTGGVLAFALVRSRDFVAHQAPAAA
jgi:hypothetical protein